MYDPAKHVSFDLETLGLCIGSGLLSIGACTFDMKNKFYVRIAPDSNLMYGLNTEASTVEWHKAQGEEKFIENFGGITPLGTAIEQFNEWFKSLPNSQEIRVWSKGLDFDIPMYDFACRKVGTKVPWHYRNKRDFRTLENIIGKLDIPGYGSHTALEDAIWQAKYLSECINIMIEHYGVRGDF